MEPTWKGRRNSNKAPDVSPEEVDGGLDVVLVGNNLVEERGIMKLEVQAMTGKEVHDQVDDRNHEAKEMDELVEDVSPVSPDELEGGLDVLLVGNNLVENRDNIKPDVKAMTGLMTRALEPERVRNWWMICCSLLMPDQCKTPTQMMTSQCWRMTCSTPTPTKLMTNHWGRMTVGVQENLSNWERMEVHQMSNQWKERRLGME